MNRESYGILIGIFTVFILLAPKFITIIGIIILSFFISKELKETSAVSTSSLFVIPIILSSLYNLSLGLFTLYVVLFFGLLVSKDIELFYKDSFILGFSGILPAFLYRVKILGNYYILGLLLSVWVLDVMSYYVGKRFGKHKLSFYISPNKTIEGFLGGLLSCVFVDILYFGFSKGIIFGIIISFSGVFGDLFKSLIKRQYGIKDFSNIFGPHGGFLDRFDSIIFSAVVFYLINASS